MTDTPQKGHNTGIAAERLSSFIDRLEELQAEKDKVAADMREVMSEAKGEGFDVPTLREVLKLRKLDRQKRSERRELVDLYLQAIGLD